MNCLQSLLLGLKKKSAMTWRLQAELPLRLEYTPKSSDRVNWPNYSSQRHKRPMSYIKTLKQKDQSTSQGLGRVGWAKSSSCQARVSDFTGWQGDQTQHVPNVRTLTAQISSVHSSRVWKLRRSSCPSRLGSTLALSQHRLTVTFYWGGERGGPTVNCPLLYPKREPKIWKYQNLRNKRTCVCVRRVHGSGRLRGF